MLFRSPTPDKNEILGRIRNVYQILSDPDMDYETKGSAIRSVVRQIVWDRPTLTLNMFYYA